MPYKINITMSMSEDGNEDIHKIELPENKIASLINSGHRARNRVSRSQNGVVLSANSAIRSAVSEFQTWHHKVKNLVEKYELKSYETTLSQSHISDHMSLPRERSKHDKRSIINSIEDEFDRKIHGLEKLREQPINSAKKSFKEKEEIVIDKHRGIYHCNHEELVYRLGSNTKRYDLIVTLGKDAQKMSLADLIKERGGGNNRLLMKEISEINRHFKEKLEVKFDLISHLENGGYRINDKINLTFKN